MRIKRAAASLTVITSVGAFSGFTPLAEPAHAQKAQLVSGTYHCDTVKRGVTVPYNLDVSLSVGPGYPPKNITVKSVDPDFNGKTFKFTSYDPQGAGTVVYDTIPKSAFSLLYLKENGLVNLSYFYMSGTSRSVKGAVCQIASSNPPADGLVRGVFIRPCEGDFYKAFPKKKNDAAVTNAADGTVAGACKDLKDSGVTDVFLPFKVDDATYSHCGQYGELLYNSAQHADRINAKFKAEYALDFDPIKAIMNACQGLKFHAWFPTFEDSYAAQMAGQKATALLEPDFVSTIFADPANQLVQFYELWLLDEIVKTYPVVGINLDYIRYAAKGEGDMPPSTSLYTVQTNPAAVENFVTAVRQRFPNLTLSADVMAGKQRRTDVGQEGILQYLNVIMPMIYTYSGDVTTYGGQLKGWYPNKKIVPDLRGWILSDPASNGVITDLQSSVAAAKNAGLAGYAIFTYESLIAQSTIPTLKSIKDKTRY